MSKFLSSAIAEAFDTQVKQAYQTSAMLKPTVTQRTCNAGIYHFRRQGRGLATPHISQSDVIPMDISHTKIPCVLEAWDAPEYTDIFDQSEVNFSELATLATTVSDAIGRREDQLIIDAATTLNTASGTGYADDIPTEPNATSGALTMLKLRRASGSLTDQGVPREGRYWVTTPDCLMQLLGEQPTQSINYNTVKALVDGDIGSFMGFKFIQIPSQREEGGLPATGTGSAVYNYAYHSSALGIATSMSPSTEVNYIANYTSWLTNGKLNAGSVAIDSLGIVRIGVDPTVVV